jgi:class 3 adenylate cyclase
MASDPPVGTKIAGFRIERSLGRGTAGEVYLAYAGERYFGLAVHRAARICAVGGGGQTVVSETTRALLEEE